MSSHLWSLLNTDVTLLTNFSITRVRCVLCSVSYNDKWLLSSWLQLNAILNYYQGLMARPLSQYRLCFINISQHVVHVSLGRINLPDILPYCPVEKHYLQVVSESEVSP